MGNEMGNNNSGLREEEDTTTEAQGNFTHEVALVKDVKEENHGVTAAESEDYHKKETVLDPVDEQGTGQTNTDALISSNRTEGYPPAESPKPETESNENRPEDSEMQPASFEKEVGEHDLTMELNLKENLLETSKSHLGIEVSLGKEEGVVSKSTLVQVSSSDDDAEQEEYIYLSVDHNETYDSSIVNGVKRTQDSSSSQNGDDNISCSSKENGYHKHNNPDEIIVSDINLDLENQIDYLTTERMATEENEVSIDEESEVRVLEQVQDRESSTETNCHGKDAFQPPPELNLMTHQDSTIEICEENLIITEPEGEDEKDDHNSFEFSEKVVSENNNRNETAEDNFREAKAEPIMVSKPEMILGEIPFSNGHFKEEGKQDCKLEEEESSDKQVVPLMRERSQISHSRGITAEEEAGEHQTCTPETPGFLFQAEDHQGEAEMEPDNAQVNGNSDLELKPANFSDFFAATASISAASSFPEETLVSVDRTASDGGLPEFLHNIIATPESGLETQSSILHDHCIDQCSKVEKAMVAGNNYETQENAERFSFDSNTDTLNVHAKIRKSPSFDFVLRREAKDEESDQNLLYQDKTAIECLSSQVDISIQSRLPHATFEEIHFNMKSDSEKSRTPFLGFRKGDDEEVDSEPTQAGLKKKDKDSWSAGTKEVASVSLIKAKDKHKRRSSLFSNCICCTSVMN
ncbi:hypothetical protein K2173_013191 [Erythroxylum novogranatense]|uniref:Uncharacterized protein n=1 Tax=Erythroxylum novogranatense TaxID=1862640 RepID=A0AAV8TFF0_9ROSI|nr:hypothetical protein K2173_013191 [Erythroxylum novogranatense]